MPDIVAKPALARTVLYDWHVAHQARMVEFGGWEMPVQYAGGIIHEHLATRRHAGLFDISHMGRFRVTGPRAEAYLLRILTNNARALEPGEAHYTILANERGGAVDDAYLYRLGRERFLLVVNAANRTKDWEWIRGHLPQDGASLEDVSEPLAMISLQGPHAADILCGIVRANELPEAKRNRLSFARFDSAEIIIARTGYTGESVGFELFCPRASAVALWDKLAALGAVPCGLGARDSLRLEAGLPLYGHELGTDPEGNEIPVFAIDLARFAVRAPGTGDYIGRIALEAQREEHIAIRRGTLKTPLAERRLRRLVQPIAVFASRKPLRAGYRLFLGERHAGYVTSGTSVPYATFYGEGLTAVPTEEHGMRPIGLALIDSDIRFRHDRPVVLDVDDGRGGRFACELVERNLWPAAPYARPAGAFVPPPPPARTEASGLEERAARLAEAARANTRWRRTECVNLIPSEQPTSAFVDALVTADPAGRYNEHNQLKALGPHSPEVCYYKGTAFMMEKEEELKAALRTFFDCIQVEPRVISGQMANDIVYDALKQFRNRHASGVEPRNLGPVLVHDLNKGGHLSAQVPGALKNYVRIDPRTGRPDVLHFPISRDNPYLVDVEETKRIIAEKRPELLVFGRSVIIQREPVREIAAFIHAEFGADNPERPVILYDAAHVLGLLGPHYQDPLAEGADLVTGSTHKTFFGPQRGVILSNIGPGSPFEELWHFIVLRAFPGHVSNHHLGTLLGLLGATYEMLAFRDEYPRKVIANARAFARALVAAGLACEGDARTDYTETHQVLLRCGRAKGQWAASLLEANNVITNPQAFYDDPSFTAASGIRMGTQEMTRYGMEERDFAELAALIAEIVRAGADRPHGHWKQEIANFRRRFLDMRYCFKGQSSALPTRS
jgi:aminomethyltransferase